MMKNRKKNPYILLYGVLFSILFFSLNLFSPSLTNFLHYRFYDVLLAAHKGRASFAPIIVDIDEKSLAEHGQWPWPRYRMAILLDKLRNQGALSIGLDMMFAEEDRVSIHSIRKEFLRDFGVDLGFKDIPHHLMDNDQRLAEALSKGPAVLGYQFLFEGDSNSTRCQLHPIRVIRFGDERGDEDSRLFIQARSVSCNLPIFSEAAAGSGFFNISPDTDGILRRVPLIIEHEGRLYPSLALMTLMKAWGVNDVVLKTDRSGVDSLYLNQTTIPLVSRGNFLIRFRGRGKTFNYLSATDVLSDRIPEGILKGKIVFIGTSASGLKELKSTPFDPVFPGVEVHATVVDNILQRDFISRPKWVASMELLGVIVFGLISTLVLAGTGAVFSFVFLGVVGMGIWQASVLAFQYESIFISPVSALLVLAGNFSILTFFRFWHEERQVKERTREIAMVQEATIESMSSLTETRDPDTGEHIKRTQNYIRLLAQYLKRHPRFSGILDDETIDLLWKSAPLHDIGKVGVSDSILLKPGKLTDQEFEEMKQHTVYGRDTILAAEKKLGTKSFLKIAREIAYTHHERWDGSGYPNGLRGEEIPVPGRLMALVDTYDALTSKRIYKSQLPHDKAVEIIVDNRGAQFDPAVVDAFVEVKDDFHQIAHTYADA